MGEQEKLSFREEKLDRGPLIREMIVSSNEREEIVGTLIEHPGARFYKLPYKDEEKVFFQLTKRGQEILEIAKSEAREASTQEGLEEILESTLGRLFHEGGTKIEIAGVSPRVYNITRRTSGALRTLEQLRDFLLNGKGRPPLLWVGAFAFWTKTEMEGVRNLGEKSMEEITSMLEERKIPLPTERIF